MENAQNSIECITFRSANIVMQTILTPALDTLKHDEVVRKAIVFGLDPLSRGFHI